jgi:hypothetical protein
LPQGLLHWGRYILSFLHHSLVTETSVKRGSNRGQGPICFLLLYRGSSPFTYCATSAGVRYQCLSAPPVPVCATSAGFLKLFFDVSEEAVLKYKLTPLARLVGYGVAGCEPTIMGIGPVPAISKSLFCFSFKLFNVLNFQQSVSG